MLDLQIAPAHLTAAGAPQTVAITALIPAQALPNLYGVPPSDAATFFRATRSGAAGTQGAKKGRLVMTAVGTASRPRLVAGATPWLPPSGPSPPIGR